MLSFVLALTPFSLLVQDQNVEHICRLLREPTPHIVYRFYSSPNTVWTLFNPSSFTVFHRSTAGGNPAGMILGMILDHPSLMLRNRQELQISADYYCCFVVDPYTTHNGMATLAKSANQARGGWRNSNSGR